MAPGDLEGVWPPTYDAEDLANQIRELVKTQFIFKGFYREISLDVDFCQGDVVRLPVPMPILDEDGDLAILDTYDYWVILGNTCDLARDLADCPYTNISPLALIQDDIPPDVLRGLKTYKMSRRFYVPSWDGHVKTGYALDLTLVASVDKACLRSNSQRIARMGMHSWLLLHSCLVRFLARDDRRFA
jgi:hypothetical protein